MDRFLSKLYPMTNSELYEFQRRVDQSPLLPKEKYRIEEAIKLEKRRRFGEGKKCGRALWKATNNNKEIPTTNMNPEQRLNRVLNQLDLTCEVAIEKLRFRERVNHDTMHSIHQSSKRLDNEAIEIGIEPGRVTRRYEQNEKKIRRSRM